MNCSRSRTLLMAWLDDELDAASHAELEQHLRACASCRQRFAAEAELEGGLAESLRDETMPAAVWQRLRGTFTPPATERPVPRVARWWPAAAAALLVAAGALWIWPEGRGSSLLREALVTHAALSHDASTQALADNSPLAIADFLVSQGVMDWQAPAAGEQDGHVVSVLGASRQRLGDRFAVAVHMSCCGEDSSFFVMEPYAIDAFTDNQVATLATGGVVESQQQSVRATAWLDAGQLVSFVSGHSGPLRGYRVRS